MSKKLLIYEFVRAEALDEVIMEGYDWSGDREANRLSNRTNSIQAVQNNAAQQAETAKHAQQADEIKGALVKFIANQLPNVRMSASRLTLADMALKDIQDSRNSTTGEKKTFATTINKQELKPWFHMLCAGVNGYLQSLNHDNVVSLLKPFHGKITELVRSLSPEITQILEAELDKRNNRFTPNGLN
jgi:hypothetical protein